MAKAFSVPAFCLFSKYSQHSFLYQILSNTAYLFLQITMLLQIFNLAFQPDVRISIDFTFINLIWFRRWLGY